LKLAPEEEPLTEIEPVPTPADPPVTLKEEEPLLELLWLLLLKEVLEPELVLKDCRLELELEEEEEPELNLDPELLDCKVCWTCWLINPLSTKLPL
jgi:hypothetical protein